MPTYWLFGLTLILIGLASQTFTTSTMSLVQLRTEPSMRGRVMAILIAIALGGTPIGAPIVGWVADRFGPRWALGIAAAAGLSAALVAVHYLAKHGHSSFKWLPTARTGMSLQAPEPANPPVETPL
jgi:MFS family permease